MLVTEKAICTQCHKEYEDVYLAPRAPYAPYWCEKCVEEINEICGGSWIACVFQASKWRDQP